MAASAAEIVDRVARVLHDEHARYIEHHAAFERCPSRATERRIASQIVERLILAGDIPLPLGEPT